MKVAAIGSRSFNNISLAEEWLFKFIKTADDEVVSGGAKGADSVFAGLARARGYKVTEYKPDWDKHGKAAGFIRNKQIIDDSDIVICAWDGASKGSQHSLNLAKKSKKPTIIIYF